jgi:hypothetical protein
MSTFDVNAFQNAQFTEASSTEFTPIPEGEFNAVVDKQDIRTTTKGQVILDVTWKIDDATVAAETGLPNPTVRQSVFLDVADNGGLEFGKGKNVSLGRLREALGQNQSGQPWSFGMLLGQVAKVRVKHRIVRDESTGEDRTYSDIAGVTKI